MRNKSHKTALQKLIETINERRLGRRRYALTELAQEASREPLELWYQLGAPIDEPELQDELDDIEEVQLAEWEVAA